MGTLNVSPPSYQMASHERRLLAFDYTADLQPGETIVSAVATLTNLRTEAAAPSGIVDGAATISGNIVAQWINQPEARAEYRFTIRVTTSTGEVLEPELRISVLY